MTIFDLSAGFWLALRYFELNLTSLIIMFNNLPRGDEARFVLERLFGHRGRQIIDSLVADRWHQFT